MSVTLAEIERMQREGLPLLERDSDVLLGICRFWPEPHPKQPNCIGWHLVDGNDGN